jgi:hypothetical protein
MARTEVIDRRRHMLAQAITSPTIDTTTWIWIGIAVVVVLVLIAFAARRSKTNDMRRRFGPEYDRTLAATGSPQRAEADLARREKRVHALDIQPITPGARARYTEAWRNVQTRFVDNPSGALADANRLLTDVMRDRGYPVETNPDRRIEDLSVEHASVIDNYRLGNEVVAQDARGAATTEDLRRAMVAYRALFADLVGADPNGDRVEGRIVEPRTDDATRGIRA